MVGTDGKPIMEREVMTPALQRHLDARRKRLAGRYLQGPFPLDAIIKASRISKNALAVLLLIHHQTTLSGEASVKLPAGLLRDFGIGRSVKARALSDLEGAGLIRVARKQGCVALASIAALRPADELH